MEQEIVCDIGNNILDFPVDLTCSHTFCFSCIQSWNNSSPSETTLPCPVCRCTNSIHNLKQSSYRFKNIIGKTKIQCPKLCEGVIKIEDYGNHIRICENATIECFHDGYRTTTPRRDIDQHIQECPHRRRQCQGPCRLFVKIKDLPTHQCAIALRNM